jgi:thiamine-phosphate pyrophosphorylase
VSSRSSQDRRTLLPSERRAPDAERRQPIAASAERRAPSAERRAPDADNRSGASILYAIIDAGLCAARHLDPVAVADACLRGGARLLQLRDKSGTTASLLTLAVRVVSNAHAQGARVIVNDRADVARLSGADGVHVGQDDLSVGDVRAIAGIAAVIGLSTHSHEQIDRALESDASYIAVGPVFATTTKETGYDARGLELVAYASGRGKPVVAIGGITVARAPLVIEAGASAVAVISDLLAEISIESRVRAFVSALPALPFKV